MSGILLEQRGLTGEFGAFITGAGFDREGRQIAFATGDGRIILRAVEGDEWQVVELHDGAVLALAPDAARQGFLTGGDDGAFRRIASDGEVTDIADFGMKWVENVASFAHRKTSLIACSAGKRVTLYDGAGGMIRDFTHPSTVTGIALGGKGKRIAASHYNGASVWFTSSKAEKPQGLEWKGSHTGIAVHPDFAAVVTAMQENALHGWKMPDGQHMRMSGYPAKCESLGFTRSGRWLASAGADTIVLWPFFGGGPMGKPPLELAGGNGAIVKRVACHPQHEVVAAGFADGEVVVADIARERILPVAEPGRGAISALCWSPDGGRLGFGTETGFIAIVDFSEKNTGKG
ncbi:MAG TPA: WD40 repeat domain-containing protein [Acetobacteraceae bacterium]|nr:WD40 repeat domain-containing protein [Acetobacteraceae bacterium]